MASIPMRLSRRDVRGQQQIQPILRGASGANLLDHGGNSLQGLAGLAQQIGPLLQMALQQQQRRDVMPQYQLRGFSPRGYARPAPLALAVAGAGDAPTDATAGAAQHNSAAGAGAGDAPTDATAGAAQHNSAAGAGAGAKDDMPAANPELDLATATAALMASADTAAAKAAACKKRPAASAKARAAAFKKRPAANAKSKAKKSGAHSMSAAARLKARPEGCSKCRGKPGCTLSCWLNGTNPY